MLKENELPPPRAAATLNDKQRTRITDNFRSAKALLGRKRPLEFASGIPYPKCSGTDVSNLHGCTPISAPLLDIQNQLEFQSGLSTPIKTSGSCPVEHAYLTPLSNILDEELDESFFNEVDTICEQRYCVKIEKISTEQNKNNGYELDKSLSFYEEAKSDPQPKKYDDYLQSLNDAQREAACSDITVPLMIVAGPGSGKTSTMVGRVLTLLKEGIVPANILAMTFTTAAVSEMRDRIGAVVGKEVAKELEISTFHSFCLQFCRSHAEKLGRTAEFLIYGHGQQRRAVIEALRLISDTGKKGEEIEGCEELQNCDIACSLKEKSKKWLKFVIQVKASGKTPEDLNRSGEKNGALILGMYNDILRSCNALDYHDLINSSVKLLTDFDEVLKECQCKWKAIVVDEFQDTSSMQYLLLRLLGSHNHITIVGDEDQSIFSFNGADVSGFGSFRRDFPTHKEVKLIKNYRSTRCIVEAASCVINHNVKRSQLKQVETDNCNGSPITIVECHNEDAQCSFVVDKVMEITSFSSAFKCCFGNISILYRRQISGRAFQVSFRDRKIPFNVHGVAFYRKKVIRAVMALLETTLPGCGDNPFRRAFKALLPIDKAERKKMVDYIDKISSVRKSSFLSVANDIFGSKISGTFKRTQLTQGRKVLSTLDMLSKIVRREPSISVVISSVVNMLPQKHIFEQRAIIDTVDGKFLNEDNDPRSHMTMLKVLEKLFVYIRNVLSKPTEKQKEMDAANHVMNNQVLQYLLDDVSDFLSSHYRTDTTTEGIGDDTGCVQLIKSFLGFVSVRETENFRSRRQDNDNSVTLTTIHQSKGLEWDIVFIVKSNDSEIPLLNEFNYAVKEDGTNLEEERRLFYVAMTRARKKLYILYVSMDSNCQLLQPSRFLKEIPDHLIEVQGKACTNKLGGQHHEREAYLSDSECVLQSEVVVNHFPKSNEVDQCISIELPDASVGNNFLKSFSIEERLIVSHLFHQWAKKQAFQDPKRLLDKVNFVIDERLSNKTYRHKVVMRALKSILSSNEALHYAQYVLRWEQIPVHRRAHFMREKQEHFQKQKIEKSMGSAKATPKQIAYLQNLGCAVIPTSRLHASHLIEQYKSL